VNGTTPNQRQRRCDQHRDRPQHKHHRIDNKTQRAQPGTRDAKENADCATGRQSDQNVAQRVQDQDGITGIAQPKHLQAWRIEEISNEITHRSQR
jgi:hypothetical protein